MALFSRSLSSSSTVPAQNYYLRKRRKWPLSPYKANWQTTFNQHQAIETFKQSSQTSTDLLTTLTNSFSLYHCHPPPNAYHFLIKTLAQNFKWDQIPRVLDHIEQVEKFETPEYILVNLIKIYGDCNMIQQAIDVFFRIPTLRCAPTVISLNSLLSVLSRRKESMRVVPQILLKSHLMKIRVEESSFCILIDALCRAKKVGYAIKLLGFMISDGYCLDGKSCSLILTALCESRYFSNIEVMGFLDEMRKFGFCPMRVDWCNVIKFLVREEKGNDALDVLEQMKMDGIKPGVICYTLVIEGVIAIGKLEKVDQLFDEMLALGLVPDIHSYNVYINGLCKQKKMERGVDMLSGMEELGCKPNITTYNIILEGFFEVGKLSRAKDILKEMGLKGVKLNSHTYGILVDGLVKGGEIGEACILVKEIVDKGFFPQASIFDRLICELCQRGLFCKAFEMLKEIAGENVAPGTKAWEALIHGSRSESKFHFDDILYLDNGILDQICVLESPE